MGKKSKKSNKLESLKAAIEEEENKEEEVKEDEPKVVKKRKGLLLVDVVNLKWPPRGSYGTSNYSVIQCNGHALIFPSQHYSAFCDIKMY